MLQGVDYLHEEKMESSFSFESDTNLYGLPLLERFCHRVLGMKRLVRVPRLYKTW